MYFFKKSLIVFRELCCRDDRNSQRFTILRPNIHPTCASGRQCGEQERTNLFDLGSALSAAESPRTLYLEFVSDHGTRIFQVQGIGGLA